MTLVWDRAYLSCSTVFSIEHSPWVPGNYKGGVIVVATLHVRAEAERADMSARRLAGACAGRGERAGSRSTRPTGVAPRICDWRSREFPVRGGRFGSDLGFSVRSARRRGFDARLRGHGGVTRPERLPQRTRQASYGRSGAVPTAYAARRGHVPHPGGGSCASGRGSDREPFRKFRRFSPDSGEIDRRA